jgi:hypothetical protein
VVEAKTFSFSTKKGYMVIRLEEKRKGFGGFILLGIKCSGWLADTVEEAMEAQLKEGFTRMHRDEVRVLKVRLGSNKAGLFLGIGSHRGGWPERGHTDPGGTQWLGLAKVCGQTTIFGCAVGGEGYANGSCNQCRRSG